MSLKTELTPEDLSILQNGGWKDCLARLRSLRGTATDDVALKFFDRAVAKHGNVLKRAMMDDARKGFEEQGVPSDLAEMIVSTMADGDYRASKSVVAVLRAIKNTHDHRVRAIGNYDMVTGLESVSNGAADEIELLLSRGATDSPEYHHLANTSLNLMQVSLLITMSVIDARKSGFGAGAREIIYGMLANLMTVMRGQFPDSLGAVALNKAFEDASKTVPTMIDTLYSMPLDTIGVEITLDSEEK